MLRLQPPFPVWHSFTRPAAAKHHISMTLVGACLTSVFCLAVAALPRRQAALALVGATLFITQGQTVNLGINFMAIRFVELAAAVRVVMRGEFREVGFTKTDRWLILFFTISLSALLIRNGTLDFYDIGVAVDALLVFFAFRALICTPEDLTYFMKGMVWLLVPFALLMAVEAVTGRNLFAFMGGVPVSPELREGHYRCQGSFRHAITAGSLGASFVGLFVGFLFQKTERRWAIFGVAACLAIVIASHSSGPLMTTLVAGIGWGCWVLRRKMQVVRRCILAGLVMLHLVMKAPVWYIFARLSDVLGGDGWHRSNLINQFINSFGEWWLFGMSMERTVNWAATVTTAGFVDMTNYYVSIGVMGGFFALMAFLIMLTVCFKQLGLGLWFLRASSTSLSVYEPMLWGVGVAVCAHAINFTAVLYWDQSYVIWYLHLALATSLSGYFISRELVVVEEDAEMTPLARFAA